MKGTYVFKQNGVEIARSENIITSAGKKAILKYLSNSSLEWASSLAVGAINTNEPTLSDTKLEYEIARSAVSMKSYSEGDPNLIVVKGTISPLVSANIYEVGLFPFGTSQVFGTRDQLIITDFSNLDNWQTTNGTQYSSNYYQAQAIFSPRIGLNSINLPSESEVTGSGFGLSLSDYGVLDTIDILVNIESGKSGTLKLTLIDVLGNSAYMDYAFNSQGYQVLSKNINQSILNLSIISSIKIETIGGDSDIVIDAIRISVEDELTENTSIVSRSVLIEPIAKLFSVPLDIEYYVQLS